MIKINAKVKEQLVSAVYTFVTMFVLTVLVSIQDLTWEAIGAGALAGVLVAGARAGIKSIIPLIQTLAKVK